MTLYMFHMYSMLHVPCFAGTGGGEDTATGDAALWPLLLRLGTVTPLCVSEINDVSTWHCTCFTCIQRYMYLLLLGLVEERILQLEMLPSDLSPLPLRLGTVTALCVSEINNVSTWHCTCFTYSTLHVPFARTGGGEDAATRDAALWLLLSSGPEPAMNDW